MLFRSVDGFAIDIVQGANKEEFKEADRNITIKNNNMYCPHCEMETPITSLRGDRRIDGETIYGLRLWEKDEFIPRKDDVFQERLYCIRYVKEYIDEKGKNRTERYYTAPTLEDLEREEKVIDILEKRFIDWQNEGYIPSSKIEEGYNTTQPIRERGWQYWHQLFNPRQLLINGLFLKMSSEIANEHIYKVLGLLGVNRLGNWNSKLSRWNPGVGVEKGQEVYSNQALNTMYNYITRSTLDLDTIWGFSINNTKINTKSKLETKDARNNDDT